MHFHVTEIKTEVNVLCNLGSALVNRTVVVLASLPAVRSSSSKPLDKVSSVGRENF